VFLGGSSRLVKILRVCGVGWNFFKMSVKELGDVLEGETTVQQMIVSFAPTISFTSHSSNASSSGSSVISSN